MNLLLPELDGNYSLPFITGAKLSPDEYELASLHYHWGEKNNRGSEVRLLINIGSTIYRKEIKRRIY